MSINEKKKVDDRVARWLSVKQLIAEPLDVFRGRFVVVIESLSSAMTSARCESRPSSRMPLLSRPSPCDTEMNH